MHGEKVRAYVDIAKIWSFISSKLITEVRKNIRITEIRSFITLPQYYRNVIKS